MIPDYDNYAITTAGPSTNNDCLDNDKTITATDNTIFSPPSLPIDSQVLRARTAQPQSNQPQRASLATPPLPE